MKLNYLQFCLFINNPTPPKKTTSPADCGALEIAYLNHNKKVMG